MKTEAWMMNSNMKKTNKYYDKYSKFAVVQLWGMSRPAQLGGARKASKKRWNLSQSVKDKQMWEGSRW